MTGTITAQDAAEMAVLPVDPSQVEAAVAKARVFRNDRVALHRNLGHELNLAAARVIFNTLDVKFIIFNGLGQPIYARTGCRP